MAVLKNRAKMSTSATGTGSPITLGSAESGYQTFADAGVANADVVRYVIEDTGGAFEIGTGTYTASGTTLSRTVSESSNSNNAINLSGSATVFIGAIDDDIAGGPRGVDFNDNVKATFGTGSDLEIYHDGTYSYIKDDTSAQMRFQNGDFQFYSANGFQSIAKFHETSGVDLYYQNSKKFETTSSGVKVTGDAELYGDAPKLTFNDVSGGTQIDFSLQANNGTFTLTDETNSDTVLTAAQNGAVSVYHNNAVKLATTSSGIQTTGTLNVNGAYALPTSDGTNGQVLTSDGSGAVTFADAGGGADLYAANPVSATDPTAAGNNGIAIGSNASNTTTHGSANGLAIGTDAVADYWATALGAGTDATGNSSLAVGYNAQATGTKSTAIMRSYASGTTALAAVIDNNTSTYGATGNNSIAMGYRAKASHSNSTSIGRNSSATSSDAVALGNTATASGGSSLALGLSAVASGSQAQAIGNLTDATATNSSALGNGSQATASNATAIGGATASASYSTAIGKTSGNNGAVATSGNAAMALNAPKHPLFTRLNPLAGNQNL